MQLEVGSAINKGYHTPEVLYSCALRKSEERCELLLHANGEMESSVRKRGAGGTCNGRKEHMWLVCTL